MDNISALQHDIDAIKARNHRVELEKQWEISIARKLVIAVITYVLLGGYLYLIWQERRYLDAIVPTVWFLIGWMWLRRAKGVWIKNYK